MCVCGGGLKKLQMTDNSAIVPNKSPAKVHNYQEIEIIMQYK